MFALWIAMDLGYYVCFASSVPLCSVRCCFCVACAWIILFESRFFYGVCDWYNLRIGGSAVHLDCFFGARGDSFQDLNPPPCAARALVL